VKVFAPLAAVYAGLVILANWLASAYIVAPLDATPPSRAGSRRVVASAFRS
jgi:hypothetical protein